MLILRSLVFIVTILCSIAYFAFDNEFFSYGTILIFWTLAEFEDLCDEVIKGRE